MDRAREHPARPHTGRRRNEAARAAILEAVAALVGRVEVADLTIDTIAAAAGVGRQTIYRWWPSKSAVILDAMAQQARASAPAPDTGSVRGDLEAFLAATFLAASHPATAPFLRAVMAEAQRDAAATDLMRRFTAERRDTMTALLVRGQDRGEVPADADVELAVDQAYGLLWYRVLLGHAPLDADEAGRLVQALLRQLGGADAGADPRNSRSR